MTLNKENLIKIYIKLYYKDTLTHLGTINQASAYLQLHYTRKRVLEDLLKRLNK